MDWCRLWHDAPDDPKWRVIARKAGVRAGDVWSIWCRMMVNASKSAKRGYLDGWDDEDEAAALDFEPAEVTAIREAMEGKTLEGNRLIGWEKRQPKRERPGDDSAGRVKAFRERQADVTPCNASDGQETPRLDKSRVDKKPTTPPVVPPTGDDASGFDRFWKAYPKRQSSGANPRQPAEKAFHAAVKAGASAADLIAAAESYAAEMRAAGKLGTEFVCQAQTWLRQARWKDTTGPPAKPQATSSVDAFEARMRRMDQQEREQRQREAADADEERVSAADLASLIPSMRGNA